MLTKEFPEIAKNSPEELAWHYSKACDLDLDPPRSSYTQKAAHWWHRAGETATDRLALSEALLALKRARRYARKASRIEGDNDSELHILLDITTASELQYGPGARDVRRACDAAQRLAKNGNELSFVFRAQWADWLFTYVRGDFKKSLEIATRLAHSPAHQDVAVLQLEAHHAMWDTLFHLGELHKAVQHHHLGAVLAQDITVEQCKRGFAGHAANVCNHLRSALAFWLLGDIVHSRHLAQRGLTLAGTLDHTQSMVHAHCYTAILGILAGTPDEIIAHAASALEIAEDRSLRPLMAFARTLKNIGELQEKPSQRVLQALEDNLAERRRLGIRLFETLFQACLADGYLKVGDLQNGMKVIAEAFEVSNDTGELVFRSELHRIMGELQTASSSKNRQKAKAQFTQAMEWAARTGARLLEVRTLNSLNRFIRSYRASKKERLSAQERLKATLRCFSHGSDCQDLTEAVRIIQDT